MSDPETIETAVGLAQLHRSKRKTLAISVLPNGDLVLVAPVDAQEAEILKRVEHRRSWIIRKRHEFEEMNRNRVPLRYQSGATHRYLGKQYRLKVDVGPTPSVKLKGSYFHITSKSTEPQAVERLLTGWYREKAHFHFESRIRRWDSWCIHRQLPTPRLQLLVMPKRWGSSDQSGRIALNPELVKAPSICIDYVVAHEICHLVHPGHGKAFYNQLEQMFPAWRAVKQRLEQTM
ncbi:MAG: SprT family zinc-dependent metalloprotease [Verrucomicrobiota bacterium JB022]|nr:SprT family zinc-dependent metalloprotease [Verrucomicrobiota bacterium JB022]